MRLRSKVVFLFLRTSMTPQLIIDTRHYMKKVHPDYIKKIIAAEHHDPFSVLGMHEAEVRR